MSVSEIVGCADEQHGILDSLIEVYGPASQVFDIVLPKGESLQFRAVSDWNELEALKLGAEQFGNAMIKGHPWKDVGEPTAKTFRLASMFASLCVSPKIGEHGWLKIAHNAAFLFEHVRQCVDNSQMAYLLQAEDVGVDASKKELGATTDTAIG